MRRTNFVLSTVVAGFLFGGAGQTSAATVCLSGPNGEPDASC